MQKKSWTILVLIFHFSLLSNDSITIFSNQYHDLKNNYLLEMESTKNDGTTWLYYKGNEKKMEAFNNLINIALSIEKLWGTDEKNRQLPYSLLTKPSFILKDKKTKKTNPFFYLSLKRLFESERMNNPAFHDETIRNLIMMYDDDEYKDFHIGINGGMPYSFIIADVLRRKWPADIQADMKKRLIRHIAQEKEGINDQWTTKEGIEHSRLRFFWFLDWTDKEKTQLVEALKPAAMQASPLDRNRRYEWLALLILCDCGDKEAMEILYKRCQEMDYLYKNMEVLQLTLPFLTLVRCRETVELLTMLMAREDILDKPRTYLWKNGSLANISAICLSIMIDDMPTLYARKNNIEEDDNDLDLNFTKEKWKEVLTWLRQQKDYHFKPFNYFPEPTDEDRKDPRYFYDLNRVSRTIFGYSVQIDNLTQLYKVQ